MECSSVQTEIPCIHDNLTVEENPVLISSFIVEQEVDSPGMCVSGCLESYQQIRGSPLKALDCCFNLTTLWL